MYVFHLSARTEKGSQHHEKEIHKNCQSPNIKQSNTKNVRKDKLFDTGHRDIVFHWHQGHSLEKFQGRKT